MNRKLWALLYICLGFNSVSYSQIIGVQPEMPTFNYLTIDIVTGHPTLYWTPPAHNRNYPDPKGYIIYRKNIDPLNPAHVIKIDSVLDPHKSFYTDTSITADGNKARLTYEIASKGPTIPSEKTLDHSNIFISSIYDSCKHTIELKWTKYEGWLNKIEKYDIYLSNNPPPASFELLKTLPSTAISATITNITENRDYYIYVEAKKLNSAFISRSGLFYKKPTMPIHPATMSIDSIIAEDKRTNIYFKIDPNTGITNFQLVRWEDPDSTISSLNSKILQTFANPTNTFYTEIHDSWASQYRPFYYKIDAINSCSQIVKVTNHANSITPHIITEKGIINKIKWDKLYIDTSFNERINNSTTYQVIRFAYLANQLIIDSLQKTDQLELIDDVHEFEGKNFSIKFCYHINAIEKNPYGHIVMTSKSRIQCIEVIPSVTMPDAIVPTDNTSGFGNPRNIFIPVITFKADYTLSVYNRWGNIIFYGKNEGWNGNLSNGQFVPEGTYLYRLVVHIQGNRDIVKQGSVVVIYK